jgi:hypothetical protein
LRDARRSAILAGMNTTRRVLAPAMCALACLTLGGSAAAADPVPDRSSAYRFTTVDWPAASGDVSGAINGINDLGDLVGVYDDDSANYHGYVRYTGRPGLSALDYPGARSTYLIGISNLRTISGTYVDTAGLQHGFTYRAGRFTRLDVPGAGTAGTGFEFGDGLGTSGFGINDLGQVAGQYADAGGVGHGYIARGGRYVTLDSPAQGSLPGGFTGGTGLVRINDAGTIAGNYSTSAAPADTHPFLDRNGTITTVAPPPGGRFTEMLGLSNTGVASGVSFTDPDIGSGLGFLYDRGRLSTIRAPQAGPAGFTTVAQPNSLGFLVGEYLDADYRQHGYLALPR